MISDRLDRFERNTPRIAEVTQTLPACGRRGSSCRNAKPRYHSYTLGLQFFDQQIGNRFGHPLLHLRRRDTTSITRAILLRPTTRPLGK